MERTRKKQTAKKQLQPQRKVPPQEPEKTEAPPWLLEIEVTSDRP